jgi:hypothetical protein
MRKMLKNGGFSSLPTILFLGGLIVEVTLAVTFVLSLFSATSAVSGRSAEAFYVAYAGVNDGIIRVLRNKDCPTGSCPSSYDLGIGGRTAHVTICKDTCAGSGKTQVDAVGSVLLEKRKIRAVLTVNATTGLASVDSISEVAF